MDLRVDRVGEGFALSSRHCDRILHDPVRDILEWIRGSGQVGAAMLAMHAGRNPIIIAKRFLPGSMLESAAWQGEMAVTGRNAAAVSFGDRRRQSGASIKPFIQ
jgi:hypothetical protein